jgi:putative ABC transport system permease protein
MSAPLHTLWRISLRDLRGSARHFTVFICSLILGVASIATIGLLLASAERGIDNNADALLGGDLLVQTLYKPMPQDAKDYMAQHGDTLEYASLRTMARVANPTAGNGDITSQIAELKAVPKTYPLAGEFLTQPALSYDALYSKIDGHYGAAVEKELLSILGVQHGDIIMLGEQSFSIRATIISEPDRLGANYSLGPRIMIADSALTDTGLVQFGSLINYTMLLKVAKVQDSKAIEKTLMDKYNKGSFQVRSNDDAAPGLKRALERLGMFLTFAALSTLLIGGVGIANATQNYLSTRLVSIARFKCLGATRSDVLWIYAIEIFLLSAASIICAIIMAVALQQGILYFFKDALPIPADGTITLFPIAAAIGYGILTTLLFATPALTSATATRATTLLRYNAVQHGVAIRFSLPLIIMLVIISAAIIVLTVYFVGKNAQLTGIFFAAFIVSALIFWLMAYGLKRLAARFATHSNMSISTRIALKNLARKGAITSSFSLSLGLSLTLVVALAIIAINFYQQFRYQPPEEAPDFFLIDIQDYQHQQLAEDVTSKQGVTSLNLTPMVRGRITELNGKPLKPEMVDPKVRWALQGERGITFSDTPPENNTLTQGQWWEKDYNGEPLVSFGDELAEGMGIKLGDVMTFNVLGQNINARVANLRDINWTTLQMNFGIILSPNALTDINAMHIGTVHVDDAHEMTVLRDLLQDYPSVTVIRIKETLKRAAELFGSIATLILVVAGLTVIAGVFVIFGSLSSTLRNRAYESVLLNVLGQSKRNIRHIIIREMTILCMVGVSCSLLLGTLLSQILASTMRLPQWLVIHEIYVAVCLFAAAVVWGLSYWLIRVISARRPIDFLRNE